MPDLYDKLGVTPKEDDLYKRFRPPPPMPKEVAPGVYDVGETMALSTPKPAAPITSIDDAAQRVDDAGRVAANSMLFNAADKFSARMRQFTTDRDKSYDDLIKEEREKTRQS